MPDPTTGVVTSVGSTGVVTAACAALDVASNGVVYASMTTGGINSLYTMNTSTGAASLLGAIDQVASIQSIAIVAGAAPTISNEEAVTATADTRAGHQPRTLRAAKVRRGPKFCL